MMKNNFEQVKISMLLEAGVTNILVVTGFMEEKFQYL